MTRYFFNYKFITYEEIMWENKMNILLILTEKGAATNISNSAPILHPFFIFNNLASGHFYEKPASLFIGKVLK